jgi:hypothetical protein
MYLRQLQALIRKTLQQVPHSVVQVIVRFNTEVEYDAAVRFELRRFRDGGLKVGGSKDVVGGGGSPGETLVSLFLRLGHWSRLRRP